MPTRTQSVLLPILASALALSAQAAGVRVIFDPGNPAGGPFPSDFLTVPDDTQRTGLRVNLPVPDCTREVNNCGEITQVNKLDGFSLQPRIRVKFSGPIRPDTLRSGIFFVWLDRLRTDEPGLGASGTLTPINSVVYDPRTNTAYAKPDAAFDQSRRYGIVVTSAVRDTNGDPVEPDGGFQLCLARRIGGDYCTKLSAGMELAQGRMPPNQTVVGGSIFTTLTATSFMESARKALALTNPGFQRTGARPILNVSDASNVALKVQVRTSGEKFRTDLLPVPLSLLGQVGLGRVAFGSFQSPQFLSVNTGIDQTGTALDVPLPNRMEQIYFHVLLPSRAKPAGGYPVVLVGHGLSDSRFGTSSALIPGIVGAGYAVIAINAVGHGGGPEGTLEITDRAGTVLTYPLGGRGVDFDNNGEIGEFEGALTLTPTAPFFIRDATRQTALDFMQLTRTIRQGMDLDGDGETDLSTTRIGYIGLSFGAFVGTLLNAIEPDIASAVLVSGGGTGVEAARWSTSLRGLITLYLGFRTPSLLNRGFGFDDQYPLRYRPVQLIDLNGAVEIQEVLDRLEWLEMPGAPAAYATHLFSSTLPDVPIKRVQFQFAVGDQTVSNPSNLLLLRSANLWDTAFMYRGDLARPVAPELPANPHSFIAQIDSTPALAVSLAAQQQAAAFLSGIDKPPANSTLRSLFGRDVFEPVSYMLENVNVGGR